MAIQTKSDQGELGPLTWATIPKQVVDSVSYMESDALMELVDQLAEEDREFLDRLSRQ